MKAIIVFIFLIFSFPLFGEGDRPRGNYITREMGFVGDTSAWWEVPNVPATVSVDPIVTSVNLFWLDTEGYICKGNPGTSGRLGFIELPYPAWQQLYDRRDSDGNIFVSQEELLLFQTQRYPVSPSYTGIGEHLIIANAYYFRVRDTGQVIGSLHTESSMPLDLLVDETFLVPGYVQFRSARFSITHENCPFLESLGLAIPPPPSIGSEARPEPAQDSTRCLVRANITAQDLAKACEEGRLRGSFRGEGRLIIEEPPKRQKHDLKKPGRKELSPGKPKKKPKYL